MFCTFPALVAFEAIEACVRFQKNARNALQAYDSYVQGQGQPYKGGAKPVKWVANINITVTLCYLYLVGLETLRNQIVWLWSPDATFPNIEAIFASVDRDPLAGLAIGFVIAVMYQILTSWWARTIMGLMAMPFILNITVRNALPIMMGLNIASWAMTSTTLFRSRVASWLASFRSVDLSLA